jgi:tRNA(Ile)-lysidine synthase
LTSALHQQVRRTIRRHRLCPPGTGLLIALSGGSDSVALTLLMMELAEHGDFHVRALAHLNHRLRPTASRDEQFCRELATQLHLPFITNCVDVTAYAATQRLSIEDAARRLRYDFLHRAADEAGATRIAVGHTQDDQAETFVLKLMRGAGATGLGGIYPRRDMVIRPLLDVSREELRAFLRRRRQTWVEDETNADEANPRNRVRHRILPELDRAYGGPTRASIARAAALIRDDASWLDEVSESRLAALAIPIPEGLEMHVAALLAEPLPVRRRLLLKGAQRASGGRQFGLEHIELMDAILEGLAPAADLPGLRVELRRGKLVLVQQGVGPK